MDQFQVTVTLDKVKKISNPTVVVAAFCFVELLVTVVIIMKFFFVHKIVD